MVRPVARLSARRARTSMRLRALDARDRLAGRGGRLVPPRRLQLTGEGDFVAVGDEFLSHLIALCGLRPDDRVLDVGCGVGRLARALAGYLSVDGAYAGFDVDAGAIEWCRKRYAHFPQFAFVHADVRSARFNPDGAIDPVVFAFPFDDGSFDVAVVISVLTHLTADAALHYLGQVRRVLAPGGRMLATFFVLDPDASSPALAFGPVADGMAVVVDPALPEEAVAYEAEWVLEALRAAGLELVALHAGTWTGRPDGLSFQDLVVARA
jgi:SAM-dependent methyltransferase